MKHFLHTCWKMALKEDNLIKHFFLKKQGNELLLVQIYVDDILFGSTNKEMCKAFEKLMKSNIQMSSISEMSFLLGRQVNQCKDDIFINREKYVKKILKKFNFEDVRSIKPNS